MYDRHRAAALGSSLHDLAKKCIELKIPIDPIEPTLSAYVSDAITLELKPEQILYYSQHAFATADAIGFSDNTLHIHDLKTGETPGNFKQLMIYAAYFCLEYNIDPASIEIYLRIYQKGNRLVLDPLPEDIKEIMQKIIRFNFIIESREGLSA